MRHLFSEVSGFELAWKMFDAMPQVLLLLDEERRVHAVNEAAERFLGSEADQPLDRRFGDLVSCINALADYRGCGHSDACQNCEVRASTEAAIGGGRVDRREVRITRRRGSGTEDATFLVSANPLEVNGHKLAVMVMEEVSALRSLRDAIPSCAGCGALAENREAWSEVARLTQERPELRSDRYRCATCSGETEAA